MSFALIDWSAVSAMVTAVATLFLVIATYRLFQVTRQLAAVSRGLHQAQAMSQIISMINFSNQLVLSDDRNLRAAEELIVHDGLDHSDEAARKRWIAFVMLNKWQLLYFFTILVIFRRVSGMRRLDKYWGLKSNGTETYAKLNYWRG